MWLYKGKKLRINFRWPIWFYAKQGADNSILISIGIIEFLFDKRGFLEWVDRGVNSGFERKR